MNNNNNINNAIKAIEAWDPNRQSVERLRDLVEEVGDLDAHGIRADEIGGAPERYAAILDRVADYPAWAIDSDGGCLVGETMEDVCHVTELCYDRPELLAAAGHPVCDVEAIYDAWADSMGRPPLTASLVDEIRADYLAGQQDRQAGGYDMDAADMNPGYAEGYAAGLA